MSDKAIDKFLETNKNIKVLNIFLDNDQAGRTSGEQIKTKYSELGYTVVESYPKLKDYNLELNRAIVQSNRPTIDAPLPGANVNRTIAYLTNTKSLNADLVKDMINSGEIYQTDKDVVLSNGETKSVSNSVFAKRNDNNEVEYAIAVSYNNSADRADFKVEYANDEQARNYISRVGENGDLLVFNNAISMLTHQSYLLSAGQPNSDNYSCLSAEITPKASYILCLDHYTSGTS